MDFSRTDYSNYSSKRFPHIQVWERTDLECAIHRVSKIPALYRRTVADRKKDINIHMREIYRRPIEFADNEMEIVAASVKNLIEETSCSMREIGNIIRGYMGDKTPFFREDGDKRIPVELERIKQAFLSVKAGKGRDEIKKILYKSDKNLETHHSENSSKY